MPVDRSKTEPMFDRSDEYAAMLHRGVGLSGETKDYFLRGRVQDLLSHLPKHFTPRRILDFGCGVGDTAQFLAERFPDAIVTGIDTSGPTVEFAQKTYGSRRLSFCTVQEYRPSASVDLCYSNGVFHHIVPALRPEVVKTIYDALVPGGYFALFENNPWNPGTHLVMYRIPFDRDAKMLFPFQVKRLLRRGGFREPSTRFLFFYPNPLRFLRFTEACLARVPLGAQFYVLSRK